MTVIKPAIVVVPSVETTQNEPGPFLTRYRVHADKPGLFEWEANSAAAGDDWAALEASGGAAGAWRRLGFPDRGDDLADSSVTITVADGWWRVLPAATLSANRTITLGTTTALEGYCLELTRLDVEAYTLAVVNGGSGAGTLLTMPVSSRYWARFYFDGTDWVLRAAGAMA